MAGAAEPPPDISEVDLVMKNIFRYLDERELRACVRAFAYWERDIQIEIRNRQDVYPFLWTWRCRMHGEMHDYPQSVLDDIGTKVGKYSSRLCVPLLFCTAPVMDDATLTTVVNKALRSYLPRSPLIIIPREDGLFGCSEGFEFYNSPFNHGIVGFIIPQYPGFQIHNFRIRSPENIDAIPDDANIKGLLVFTDEKNFNRLRSLILGKSMYEIAIGGYECFERDSYSSIVAFCGENVEIASLVIYGSGERAIKKLGLFHETTLLMKKCFAFVFCTVGISKVTKMFTSLYPNIPLAGIWTESNYGTDYLPGVSEETKTLYLDNLLTRDRPKYERELKSIFVLVSIKP